jgi:hypothetical protein
MYFLRTPASIRANLFSMLLVILAGALTLIGCRQQTENTAEQGRGGFAVRDASLKRAISRGGFCATSAALRCPSWRPWRLHW